MSESSLTQDPQNSPADRGQAEDANAPPSGPEGAVIMLPAVLSPGEAVMLRNSLLAALNSPPCANATDAPIVLDGQAVVELSVQGLQVLLAFIRQAEEQKRAWTLQAPSEEFVDAIEAYGLFPQLMKWPVTV